MIEHNMAGIHSTHKTEINYMRDLAAGAKMALKTTVHKIMEMRTNHLSYYENSSLLP